MRKDLLVPVTLGVLVERWKHDRENFGCVIADQAHDIFVVPIVQCSLCHLQWERNPFLERLLPVTPVVHMETVQCWDQSLPPPSWGANASLQHRQQGWPLPTSAWPFFSLCLEFFPLWHLTDTSHLPVGKPRVLNQASPTLIPMFFIQHLSTVTSSSSGHGTDNSKIPSLPQIVLSKASQLLSLPGLLSNTVSLGIWACFKYQDRIHLPDLAWVKIWKILGQPLCSNTSNKSSKFPDRFNHTSSYLATNFSNAVNQADGWISALNTGLRMS